MQLGPDLICCASFRLKKVFFGERYFVDKFSASICDIEVNIGLIQFSGNNPSR
ncbi:hypothetical protein [Parasutterella excrementihominis]|uniref:hypothetical protein n=1 Tax=Parasutterella excrementihominis TaxID=487175 RepID=UPI003A93D730